MPEFPEAQPRSTEKRRSAARSRCLRQRRALLARLCCYGAMPERGEGEGA